LVFLLLLTILEDHLHMLRMEPAEYLTLSTYAALDDGRVEVWRGLACVIVIKNLNLLN